MWLSAVQAKSRNSTDTTRVTAGYYGSNKLLVAAPGAYLWYRTKSSSARSIMGVPSRIRTITSQLGWLPDGSTTAKTQAGAQISAFCTLSDHWDRLALTSHGTPLAPVGVGLTTLPQTGPHPHPVGLAGVYVRHRVRQLLRYVSVRLLFLKEAI